MTPTFLALAALISISVGSSPASASDCETVRIDEEPGILSGTHAINQGRLKNCSHVTGALMMTAYLRQTRNDMKSIVLSPEELWTRIQVSPPEKRAKLMSATLGRTCSAVNLINENGACDRAKVIELIRAFARKSGHKPINGNEFAPLMRELTRELKKITAHSKKPAGPLAIQAELEQIGIPAENIPSAAELASENSLDPDHLVHAILTKACKKDGWIAPQADGKPVCRQWGLADTVDGHRLHTPAEFKAKLHEMLEGPVEKIMPIGISYCSGVLTDPQLSFISKRDFNENLDYLNTPERSQNFENECKFHASIVIGRKKRSDGRCYFLIQNSWGRSCRYMSWSDRCKDGKVWVGEDALAKNIFRISYLDDQGPLKTRSTSTGVTSKPVSGSD